MTDATQDRAAERAGPLERLPSGMILVGAGHRYWFLPSWDAADHFSQGYNARLEAEADDA